VGTRLASADAAIVASNTLAPPDPLPHTLQVLVVDTDPELHAAARRALEGFVYAGHPIAVSAASSIDQASAMLRCDSDIAVVLLNVDLEAPTAGLRLIRWLRETLLAPDTRIVLRADQADRTPGYDTILRYDITDCCAKVDMTEARLLNGLMTALRAFERIRTLARHGERLAEWNRTLEDRVAERTQALRDSERRLRSILDAPTLPIVIVALSDGQVLFANESANQVLGLFETRFDQIIWCDASDRERLFKCLGTQGRTGDFEAQVKGLSGHRYWALISAITMTFDDVSAALLAFSDISGRKAMEEELKRLATTDPLTGVGNRRNLMDQGDRELRRSRRYSSSLSLMMIDIDHFKRINDAHGHAIGDLALKALVKVCLRQLREIDVVCRFGGEEFVALLPETPLEAAVGVAERLRREIARIKVPLPEGTATESTVSFTVSIGVTAPRPEDTTLGDVLQRGDAALYGAKRGGRDQVVSQA